MAAIVADQNPYDQFDNPPAAAPTMSAAPTAPQTAAANPYDQFDEPPGPDPAETTGNRDVGIGTRALMKGVGELHDMPQHVLDAIDTMSDSASNYVRGKLGLAPRAPQPKEDTGPTTAYLLERGADAAGMPKPETPAERIGSSAISALPSAILAPEAPIAGAVGNMLGGASAQGAKEAGFGPIAQTFAGLVGGNASIAGAGISAGLKGVIRGGAEGQAAMQSRLADAAVSNTPLSVGQASGNPVVQKLEAASSKLFGGGPIKKIADDQTKNLGSHVDSIVDNLSQGNEVSPTAAGQAINAGVNSTKQSMRALEQQAYGKVDELVPPQSPIDVSGTMAKLNSLTAATPGALKTTASLVPKKILDMRDNLQSDIETNGSPHLPYEAASALKTAVGNSVDWGFSPSDPVTNGALKQIHGSLKNDIDEGAAAISPEAATAVKNAKGVYAENQGRRDTLNAIIDKNGGPEAVYKAATANTKDGATKIGNVMNSIAPDHQNIVRATVLDRMGRAIPSSDGNNFSANTFLTNWKKLDPAAKDALFNGSDAPENLRANLDSFANTAGTIRGSTLFKNPSGTAEAGGHALGLAALMEGAGAALTGEPSLLLKTAGAIGGNNMLARTLASQKNAERLARSTKVPTSQMLPVAVSQAARTGNEIGRASGGKVDHEALVEKLMQRWKAAKRETDKTTKPLLNVPDAAIVRALDIAGSQI
jgi:hypothetical protein